MNAFLIHGAYGNPKENWFPWLKRELEKLSVKVFVPEFPTPEDQNLDNWMEVFTEYFPCLDENTIMIGHSLGCAFILRILELEEFIGPIKASFFVSGFAEFLDDPIFDAINKSFVYKKFGWRKIRKNCKRFFVFHSDNDPYVSLEKSKNLAKNLGVDAMVVKNAGHFNTKSDYTKFNVLLDMIKKEM